jgi:hypothetical protein
MKRFLPLLVAGFVLALAAILLFQFTSPRLLSVEPAADSLNVPSRSSLRLAFSRQMQPDSIIQRLRIQPEVEGDFTWEGRTLVFTPSNGWPDGIEIQVTLDAGGSTTGFISQTMRQGYQGVFQVNPPRLVYLFPALGPANLFSIQPETGEVLQLTEFPGGVLDFDVSPRLNVIYFSARNTQGGSDIYRLDISPSNDPKEGETPFRVQPVIECLKADCSMPRLAPLSDYLVFEKIEPVIQGGLGFPRIWLVPLGADGQASGEPALVAEPDHQTIQPAWTIKSPFNDSSQAFSELLLIFDATLSSFRVFHLGQDEIASFPNNAGEIGSWEPGGNAYTTPAFYYLSGVLPDSANEVGPVINSRLTRYLLEGSEPVAQDLSMDDSVEDMLPAYAPDKSFLAFARRYLSITRWTPGRQIWLMPLALDGSPGQPYSLTDDPFYTHYDFAWSPDSQRLAYVRFNQTVLTEQPEIWIISLLTFAKEQLVVGGFYPQWLP